MRTSISAAGAAVESPCTYHPQCSQRGAEQPGGCCSLEYLCGFGLLFSPRFGCKHCLCLVEICHNPYGLCVVCPFFTGPQGRTCSISGQLRQQSFWLVVSLLPVVSVHRRFYLSHAGRKAHLEIGMLCSRKPCSHAPGRSCCRCSRVLEMLSA